MHSLVDADLPYYEFNQRVKYGDCHASVIYVVVLSDVYLVPLTAVVSTIREREVYDCFAETCVFLKTETLKHPLSILHRLCVISFR